MTVDGSVVKTFDLCTQLRPASAKKATTKTAKAILCHFIAFTDLSVLSSVGRANLW